MISPALQQDEDLQNELWEGLEAHADDASKGVDELGVIRILHSENGKGDGTQSEGKSS